MRLIGEKENIDYSKTNEFFNRRVAKYNENNPYSVTMYQDNNPELVKARNQKEIEKLLPKLQIDENSKVLDVACGVGRWSDAIEDDIEEYCGIDFCEGLIDIAKERSKERKNRSFLLGSGTEVRSIIQNAKKGKYNRVLLIGALIYLNDDDLLKTLEGIEKVCKKGAIICIREPIGIKKRLTLKEQFSEELHDEYNAIYRTRDELYDYISYAFLEKGFFVREEEFLFDDSKLNNRKETAQYYFLLERSDKKIDKVDKCIE